MTLPPTEVVPGPTSAGAEDAARLTPMGLEQKDMDAIAAERAAADAKSKKPTKTSTRE